MSKFAIAILAAIIAFTQVAQASPAKENGWTAEKRYEEAVKANDPDMALKWAKVMDVRMSASAKETQTRAADLAVKNLKKVDNLLEAAPHIMGIIGELNGPGPVKDGEWVNTEAYMLKLIHGACVIMNGDAGNGIAIMERAANEIKIAEAHNEKLSKERIERKGR